MPAITRAVLAAATVTIMLAGCASQRGSSETRAGHERLHDVESVLDQLHTQASRADFDAYFALFAPGAIFLGTDGTERWTLDQFKAYTKPYFDSGQGWTYTPRDRHVTFSPDDHVAWFDELLDNAKYAECRGTGVLVRTREGTWKIVQYSLAKTIPNERMDAVVEAIGVGNAP